MKTRLLIIFGLVFALGFIGTAFATHDPNQRQIHSIILPPDMKEKTFDEFMEWCVPKLRDMCAELYEKNKVSNVLSPLKQIKSGIPVEDIECKSNLVLAIKHNGSPACVKPETKTKLIERGWAIEKRFHGLTKPQIEDVRLAELGCKKTGNQTYCDLMIQEKITFYEQQNQKDSEPVETNSDFSKIVDANNQFAIDFYSQIKSDKEENVFFSPWSISTAFAIAYEGARGNTAEEIQDVFGFIENDKNRRTGFQNIQQKLNEKNSEYKLNVVNALWIKQGYQIKQEYIDVAKTYYDSEVDNVNFVTDEGVNIINEWVKSKTNNKIDELLAKGSTDELTRLVITNAIYFKGEWMYPFSPDWTRQSDFHINKDKTVKVSMMDLDDRKLNYAQNELLEILELPYKGEKVSMLILLPKEIEGLKSLEENLTGEKLSQWQESLSETQIAVLLPKFTAETKYDLKDNLQNMDMKIPFDKFNADFSGINETERLYIDQAVHKAFVEVNELGTEAAAATGIEMRLTSGPPATFRADHPFVFLIQDNETGQILFIGKVVDPTV